jgi:uncharacterized Rmd1/YagE family protein
LDTPEFFWEHSHLEGLYEMATAYLDLDARVDVLNQRLCVIQDLLQMLGDELNHAHSSFLEWVIIILILIEVVVVFAKDIFNVI